ncbi:hypothetical protein DBR17_17865 [Sphingomonas sp. HMWF008]|nr:hypothetical protein DBR17_17865 [Sphingomonas sp. HMWF008]
MLSACATSRRADLTAPAANPIVETRAVTRVTCPAEVTAEKPAEVAPYDGPAVDAPAAFWSWVGAHFARELALDLRIDDAKAQCPK